MSLKHADQLAKILRHPPLFAQAAGLSLRSYQQDVIRAIMASILGSKGLSFVVMFPRQSGKNELQAQLESYLLLLFSQAGAEIVKISPTWKPQTINAMNRLERVLTRNLLTRGRWTREAGYIYRIGQASCIFLSGNPEASIVGHTAGTLLEIDEAQDIEIDKYDKEIAPMAASTNATIVFYGTAWTSRTLLARELRAAKAAQDLDGQQRVFVVDADRVGQEVPAYRAFVETQLARLGRQHPMIKTQYFCEEIDAQAGLFNAARTALMRGSHKRQTAPTPDALYCFALDVAGGDERIKSSPGDPDSDLEARRDSTVLTIALVDRDTLADPALRAPTFRIVSRRVWRGSRQTEIYAQVKALAETWNPRFIVIDSTGIGAGLTSFLTASLGERVIPFTFTQASKSKLGYDFLTMIDSGRYREHADADPLQDIFWQQLTYIQAETKDGPGHVLSWSVPDGTRDPATGELIHDDFVMSAALLAALDSLPWPTPGQPVLIRRRDILEDIDSSGF